MTSTSSPRIIAALYVHERGPYDGLEGVDAWPESRDARLYDGPHPVVAHPPCSRWCQLAGLVQARYGHKVGDDGGCFESALAAVRRWGGVLEHPAFSKAWPAFTLNAPPVDGGWIRAGMLDPGWACHVEQAHYGHRARKATWLYAVGCSLPCFRWGPSTAEAVVSWTGNREWSGASKPRIGKREAAATPTEFRDMLIAMARSVEARP